MIKLIVLVSSVLFAALAEDWEFSKYPKEFSKNTTVIQLTQKNFNTKTKLGFQHIEKPWFILFWSKDCPACPRLIPIWEELAQKQAKRCNIAAVNVEKHPDLKDRFLVDYLPTMIYFATNDRMYYFDGERSFKKLNRYVAKEQYKRNIREGQKIPTRINTVKKWYHKIFQPIMIPVVIVVFFIMLILYIVVEDRKYERIKYAEARKLKQEAEENRKKQIDENHEFLTVNSERFNQLKSGSDDSL